MRQMVTRFQNMRIWQTTFGLLCAALLVVATHASAVQAQDTSGPTKQEKAQHYSLYYENFKNENFASARKDLRWILENAPGFPKADDRNYERAVELYAGLAEQTDNPDKQTAYLDTAATILKTAPAKMDEADLKYSQYEWELEKGRFIQLHGNQLPESIEGLDSAARHYEKAFDLAPEEIDPYYIDQVIKAYLNENRQDEALEFMNKADEVRGDDSKVSSILSNARSKIFGRNPQAEIDFYRSQLEKNPDDVEMQMKLFRALSDQGNIAEASKLADKLLEQDELPAETYRQIAEMQLQDGRPRDAFSTYQRAIDAGAELKAEDYFNMGTAQRRVGQLSKARTYYRKAIDARSDFGKAYIAIGDLYANAVSECGGSKMSRNDKAVYWLALDMYQRAKNVDDAVASEANSKISTYRQYMPNQEDIFYRSDWEVGNSFRIDYGCYSWVNETTTVRKPS